MGGPRRLVPLAAAIERAAVAAGHAAVAAPDVEDALEGVAELPVEDAVDDRVHGAVEVAEPREHAEHQRRNAAATERRHQVDGKERNPAQQEHSHDHAQRDGRFVLRQPASTAAAAAEDSPRGELLISRGAVVDDQGRLGVASGPLHGLGVAAGVPVESIVEERHGDARQVEADHRRYDRVDGAQVQYALLVVSVVARLCRRRPVGDLGAVRGRVLADARMRRHPVPMPSELDW